MRKTSKAKGAAGSHSAGARECELERLKEIEKKSYASRSRFWERDFLQAVYELWWRWPWWTRWVCAAGMARRCGVKVQPSTHAIRIVIDCSSPRTDARTRSRWALALRLAADKKLKPSELEEFFAKSGGIAGRANEFKARSRAKKVPKGKL
jgi:hypothetical protein